jgi:hypothetical protein
MQHIAEKLSPKYIDEFINSINSAKKNRSYPNRMELIIKALLGSEEQDISKKGKEAAEFALMQPDILNLEDSGVLEIGDSGVFILAEDISSGLEIDSIADFIPIEDEETLELGSGISLEVSDSTEDELLEGFELASDESSISLSESWRNINEHDKKMGR